MGKERLYQYLCAFGFGEKTHVGLPGEGKGIVHHPRYWPPVVLDTISFGQGSLSRDSGGHCPFRYRQWWNPDEALYCERITNEKGEVVQSFQPERVRRVISEETAKKGDGTAQNDDGERRHRRRGRTCGI